MTDDVIESGGTVTFRQNLWKRIVGIGASLLFLAMGAALSFMPLEAVENILIIRAVGYGSLLMAVFGLYGSFTRSRTVLIASHEGILPNMVAPQYRTLIPWSNIDRFGEAVATMRGNKIKYLAVYLHTPQEFQTPMQQAADQAVSSMVSDGGKADLYIPGMMLPESVEKTIERLNRLRPVSPL